MSNHLATFNVFEEHDGSLYVTIADAGGLRRQLDPDSPTPLYDFAMQTLYAAVKQMRDRQSPRSQAINKESGE